MAHRLRHCSSFMASSSPPLNYLCQPLPIPLLEPPPPLIFPPHESFPSSLPASFQQYCPPQTSSQVFTIAHDGGDPAANPNCWNNCQISLSKDGAACPVRQLSSLSSIIKSEMLDARSQFGAVHGPDVLLSNIQAGGFPFSDQASLIINPGAWAMGASNIASQPLDDQRVASTSRALQQTSMASLLFDSGFVERAARSSSLADAEYASFPTGSAAIIPEDTDTNNLITTTINASDGFGKLHFVSSANASAPTDPRLQIASSDESGQSGHEVNAISDSIPVQIRQESPLEHRSARQCGSASSSGELVAGTFPDTHGRGPGNAATSRRRKRLEENTNNMRHCSPTDKGDNKLLVGSSTKKHKASLVSSPKVTDQSLITAGEEEDKERISTASEGTSKIKDTIVSKDRTSCEAPKQDFIHVRARRGQATDSHSLAERVRREKISERMKFLQDLVPGCNKITGKAMMLDEIINYVKSLQNQVEFLSMKLASISPSMGLMGESVKYSTRHAEREVMPLVGCEVLDKVRPMDDLTSHFDQSRQWHGRDLIGQNGKSAGAYISRELSATEIHCSPRGFPLQLHALNSYSHYDSKFLYLSEVE